MPGESVDSRRRIYRRRVIGSGVVEPIKVNTDRARIAAILDGMVELVCRCRQLQPGNDDQSEPDGTRSSL